MAFQKALVVDDSKLARITLKKKLEQRGMQVAMVESGQLALAYLQGENVDIIFMDHLMPEMDGFETTQQIKADPLLQHIPVIMCSGKDNEGYLEEAQAIGATNVLSKPPETSALEEILAQDVPVAAEIPAEPVEIAVETPVPVLEDVQEMVSLDDGFPLSEEPSSLVAEPKVAVEAVSAGIDRQAIIEIIEERLPNIARQREDILADLSKTQTRVLEDFSGGVDQKLTVHEDALAQIREELKHCVESQTSLPSLDEAQVHALIEQRIAASQDQSTLEQNEYQQQLSDQLEALTGSTLQSEEKLSTLEAGFQQKIAGLEQQLSDFRTGSAEDSSDDIDWESITEQASRAAVDAAQQGIQNVVAQAIDQRIPQITSEIGDQVQLQITYQLSQLEGSNVAAATPTPTVDQAMGVNDEQMQVIIEEQITQQLTSKLSAFQAELAKGMQPDTGLINSIVAEQIALSQQSSCAEEERNTGMDSMAVSQQQLDEIAGQFAETQQKLVSRSRRTTMILGVFVGLGLLAVIAQWMG